MPTITELPFDASVVSLSYERDAIRSSGLHLSTIIKDMMITAGVAKKYKGRDFLPQELHLLFEQGFLWENLVKGYIESTENQCIEWDRFVATGLSPQIAQEIAKSEGTLVRPGECCLDGIYMTPDAINLKLWHVEEWKATSLRSQGFSIAAKRPEWLYQIAGYAKYYGMTKAILRVWHSGQVPPTVKQWILEFSTQEIEDNWDKIRQHRDFMVSRKKGA